MADSKGEPEPVRSATKMSKEDAERLRELLRRTRSADLSDPPVLQRIGRIIAQAIYRPFKRDW